MAKARVRREELWKPRKDAEELRNWLRSYLQLQLPAAGVCKGHCSPFEYLSAAYFEPARDVVVWAPRGGGKTRLGAVATLLDLLHKPGIAVRILGGSLDQSLHMWGHLCGDIERLVKGSVVGRVKARGLTLDNGSSVGVVTQSQRAVRGLRVQKLRCDEVEVFDPRVWEAAQLVTRSLVAGAASAPPTDGGAKPEVFAGVVEALSTVHRPGGLMEGIVDRATEGGVRVIRWCLLEVLERCPRDRECGTCALKPECDGIAKERCDGFVSIDDAIRLKRRVSKEQWETEMLCLRPSRHGAVFGHFDAAVHVRESLPPVGPDAEIEKGEGMYLGIDFGFRNPFVCLWIRRDCFGRSLVLDEYVRSEAQLEEHVAEIRSRIGHGPVRRVGCDPAGSARNEQTGVSNVNQLRAAGFKVSCRRSTIQDGLEMIRAGLRSGTGEVSLFIHPRCKQLITAMRAYRYGEKDRTEVPLKDGHDHVVDALRYYFVNRDAAEVDVRSY